jgi:hypothetical protein
MRTIALHPYPPASKSWYSWKRSALDVPNIAIYLLAAGVHPSMPPHIPNRRLHTMSRARCLFENPSQLLKNSESLAANNHFVALTNVPVHDPGFTSASNFLTPLRKCFAKPGLRRRDLNTGKRKSWDGIPERISRDTRLSHYCSARPTAGMASTRPIPYPPDLRTSFAQNIVDVGENRD